MQNRDDRSDVDLPPLGSTVLYLAPHGNAMVYDQSGRGCMRPAIVTQTRPDLGQAWPTPGGITLTILEPTGPRVMTGVRFSREPRAGHWSPPPSG